MGVPLEIKIMAWVSQNGSSAFKILIQNLLIDRRGPFSVNKSSLETSREGGWAVQSICCIAQNFEWSYLKSC